VSGNPSVRRETLRLLIARHPAVDLTLRDNNNATVAGHCAQRKLNDELLDILQKCGPGGAGRMVRGEKVYLAKKAELTQQLQGLSVEMLGGGLYTLTPVAHSLGLSKLIQLTHSLQTVGLINRCNP
jgi:hypothetical protein